MGGIPEGQNSGDAKDYIDVRQEKRYGLLLALLHDPQEVAYRAQDGMVIIVHYRGAAEGRGYYLFALQDEEMRLKQYCETVTNLAGFLSYLRYSDGDNWTLGGLRYGEQVMKILLG